MSSEQTPQPPAHGDEPLADQRPQPLPQPLPLFRVQMIYQNEYVWLIFVSTMDIMLTWTILEKRGGVEVNPIARYVIDRWELWGAILFKFGLMLFVILVCEYIGRNKPRVGSRLARLAVFISAIPPAYSIGLLFYTTFVQTH